MTLGFFGDSFCATIESGNILFETYIKKLANNYSANIVHTGCPGSSIGDVIMLQLNEVTSIPDVCIFVWTDSPRLFNREIRNINHASASIHKDSNIWTAANEYYKYLYDEEFTTLQYKALIEYIDNNILPTFPETTKIIHLWAFAEKNGSFIHRWKQGVEIRPALINVSVGNRDFSKLGSQYFPNHIGGEIKNNMLFNWIEKAIDNYNSGDLLQNGIFR